MVICLIFLVLILVVNLPAIVQKSLAGKLVYGDYSTENGQLKMIEWFKLYPLKKLLLALLWLFCAYISIRRVEVFWNEKYQGLIWIELFFIGFTLLSAYKIWKYIKTPYHCAIVLKKFDFKYMFMGNTNNIWITYYGGKGLILPFSSTDLSGDRGEEVKQVLQRIMEKFQ